MAETLTGDYWTQTLVSALETQKARAPAALAFRAAQVVLGARALFSDQLLQNLLDQSQPAGRTAREAHHLFPINWLRSKGVVDRRHVNQVANVADGLARKQYDRRPESISVCPSPTPATQNG